MSPIDSFSVTIDSLDKESPLNKAFGRYLRNEAFNSVGYTEDRFAFCEPAYPLANFDLPRSNLRSRLFDESDPINKEFAGVDDGDKRIELWERKYSATTEGRRLGDPRPIKLLHDNGEPFIVDVWDYGENLAIMQLPFVYRDVATKERLVSPLITSRSLEESLFGKDVELANAYTKEELGIIKRIIAKANKKLQLPDTLRFSGIHLREVPFEFATYNKEDAEAHIPPYPIPRESPFSHVLYLTFELDPICASEKMGVEFREYLSKHTDTFIRNYVDSLKNTVQAVRSFVEEREHSLDQIAQRHLDRFS